MRVVALICSFVSSVLASTAVDPFSLQAFIVEIGVYPLDSIPTKLPKFILGFRTDLYHWARLPEDTFIELAKEEIRTAHRILLEGKTNAILSRPVLSDMAARFEDENERLAEFAKIYRTALRNMEDYKRK